MIFEFRQSSNGTAVELILMQVKAKMDTKAKPKLGPLWLIVLTRTVKREVKGVCRYTLYVCQVLNPEKQSIGDFHTLHHLDRIFHARKFGCSRRWFCCWRYKESAYVESADTIKALE